MRKQDNRIVVISGGVDSIASACIQKFCADGARVILWDNDELKAKVVMAEFKAKKLLVEFQEVNIESYEATEQRAKALYDRYKRIDVLLNNASSSTDGIDANWQLAVERSIKGVMNCIKAVSPYMVLANVGRILNTTALLGLYGDVNQANYSAVKNGVLGISKIWTQELSKHGITVNTVAPGYVESEYINKNTSMVIASIKEKIPARKIGTAQDIANAYFFLASEEAGYISGAILHVDGGYSV